jgi:methanogenic corrinoid protein MtbC1
VSSDLTVLQDKLWDAVIAADEYAAAMVVFSAVDAEMIPEDVLLDLVAPVQRRVGTEWAANRITVAQEHAATAINDRVIAALAHHPASLRTPHRGRVTVACVDGEWHAFPARLLAEVLRLRGWQVDFLGAQVPTPHLIAHLHQNGPDAVALSCMIPTRLPAAHAAITACQAAGVPVLAGGAAFGHDGRFARLLGADAWAPDARAAEHRLGEGIAAVPPTANHQPIDDLPHLADQEYTLVQSNRPTIVARTVADLEDGFPALRDYTDEQRDHTVQDIAQIVEFLAAALYTDDDELFTQFIVWTGEILEARNVPAASLDPALGSIAGQLSDFPRTQRLVAAARTALTVRSSDPSPIA